jgi:hypothetical protein
LVPEWAAYASHDFHGDDLRRRWDDQKDLTIENGHPVVHAGAGSHSSYFRRGEYQAEVNLPLPGWLAGMLQSWNKFWTQTLGQPPVNAFHVPFVDYARGGLRIGPDGPQVWSPALVDESTPWVNQFRGLWGLFARDPISGENAPAGPMYNRDGTPRGSWYDPLGFAGLDKVPPPPQALRMLEENRQEISRRQAELEKLVPQKAAALQSLGTKAKGMESNPHLARLYAALQKEIAALHLGRAGCDPDPVRDRRVDPAGRLRADGGTHHADPVPAFLEVDDPGGAAGDGGVVDGAEAEGAGGIKILIFPTRRTLRAHEGAQRKTFNPLCAFVTLEVKGVSCGRAGYSLFEKNE